MDPEQPEHLETMETGESVQKHNHTNSPTLVMEAAALLTLWSVLVINEGAIRLIDLKPSLGAFDQGDPVKILPFLGALFEVFFGLLGLYVGLPAFILRKHSAGITKLVMAIQTLLGYYVFVIFVFVVPAVKASNLEKPVLIGLSLGESKFLIVLGIFTSFHFCLALQGGQFVFMARLIAADTGKDFLKQATGARMRAMFWNGNMAMSGLWTLITGALINSNVGSGRLTQTYEFPPNVGQLPGLTIFVGVLLLAWGIVGIVLAAINMAPPTLYFAFSGLVYLMAMLNFGILQFGLLDEPPAGAVALHNGLVFMVVFLGPYFVHLANKERVMHNN